MFALFLQMLQTPDTNGAAVWLPEAPVPQKSDSGVGLVPATVEIVDEEYLTDLVHITIGKVRQCLAANDDVDASDDEVNAIAEIFVRQVAEMLENAGYAEHVPTAVHHNLRRSLGELARQYSSVFLRQIRSNSLRKGVAQVA